MHKTNTQWVLLSKKTGKNVQELLLENRGIKTREQKQEFLNPLIPEKINLKKLGVNANELRKSVNRIKTAIKKNEPILIYGDYDADGICSTAILWETIYKYTKSVIPYLPDRFSEGYGINPKSIEKIIKDNPKLKLIITVDNGIVAFEAIDKANNLGIDVIVTDHHQQDKSIPKAYSIIHTDKISGSGISYLFAREIEKYITKYLPDKKSFDSSLELAAIGTIADQLPLIKENRSIAKYGIQKLSDTKRPGLLELYADAAINKSTKDFIGTYEINYLIAPRLNAMGRLKHAIDSLRLLCTKNKVKAQEIARHIGLVNRERQKVVEIVIKDAERIANTEKSKKGAILIKGDYHEGVIGLAAGKLVEKFGRPAIVFSLGEKISKASARSIPGFDIIKEIKKIRPLLLTAGGHPMAAGFSMNTINVDKFINEFNRNSLRILTSTLLTKSLKIDLEIKFDQINWELLDQINTLKPVGVGNPSPTFLTNDVTVESFKKIGSDSKHLKIGLKNNDIKYDAIAFNLAERIELTVGASIDVVYAIEKNEWNGNSSLQLNIKDIKLR